LAWERVKSMNSKEYYGNHAGKTLQEVVKDSPDYLHWMINRDFPEDVIKIIRNALKGVFPSKD